MLLTATKEVSELKFLSSRYFLYIISFLTFLNDVLNFVSYLCHAWTHESLLNWWVHFLNLQRNLEVEFLLVCLLINFDTDILQSVLAIHCLVSLVDPVCSPLLRLIRCEMFIVDTDPSTLQWNGDAFSYRSHRLGRLNVLLENRFDRPVVLTSF